jgi:hypothetical protein
MDRAVSSPHRAFWIKRSKGPIPPAGTLLAVLVRSCQQLVQSIQQPVQALWIAGLQLANLPPPPPRGVGWCSKRQDFALAAVGVVRQFSNSPSACWPPYI